MQSYELHRIFTTFEKETSPRLSLFSLSLSSYLFFSHPFRRVDQHHVALPSTRGPFRKRSCRAGPEGAPIDEPRASIDELWAPIDQRRPRRRTHLEGVESDTEETRGGGGQHPGRPRRSPDDGARRSRSVAGPGRRAAPRPHAARHPRPAPAGRRAVAVRRRRQQRLDDLVEDELQGPRVGRDRPAGSGRGNAQAGDLRDSLSRPHAARRPRPAPAGHRAVAIRRRRRRRRRRQQRLDDLVEGELQEPRAGRGRLLGSERKGGNAQAAREENLRDSLSSSTVSNCPTGYPPTCYSGYARLSSGLGRGTGSVSGGCRGANRRRGHDVLERVSGHSRAIPAVEGR